MTPAQKLERFSNRSDYYARSRPGYPDAIIDMLRAEAGWDEDSVVADIGAGTGLSSELFLRHGGHVFAVEPNADMRAASVRLQAAYPKLTVLSGTAESTSLPDASVDFIAAATAFHWFQPELSHAEFARILRPGGQVILMWNERRSDSSAFLKAYEEMLQNFSADYKQNWGSERKSLVHNMDSFFQGPFETRRFENPQQLDYDGLHARLLSASYAPLPGEPGYHAIAARLREIFDQHQEEGRIAFEYETVVFFGGL